MRNRLVIGTRKSALALWQSEFVRAELMGAFPGLTVELKHVVTSGDKTQESNTAIPLIGGKGLFTAELEECLVKGEIDLAVHSLKDLPTVVAQEFAIGAIPARASVGDAFISRSGKPFAEIDRGGVIGTSSVRRASQLLHLRPDLKIAMIRGNVDTRLRKLRAEGGEYDAIVLARAGLERLGLEREITQVFSDSEMLPAPGQGALGIECRANDDELLQMLKALHDPRSAAEVTAERRFLHALGAGCNTPVAARAAVQGDTLSFVGRCLSPDGARLIEVRGEGATRNAQTIGDEMATEALSRGFKELMPSC